MALSYADQVRGAYARWNETKGGSAETFLDLLAENVEMRTSLAADTDNALAGARQGIGAARDYLSVLAEDWEMLDYPTHEIIADGDTVVWIGRCHWRYKTTGKEIDCPKVDIWHFADGKAVRFLEMFDTLGFARTTGLI